MTKISYTLRYLPLFQKDLNEKIDYIVQVLKNPSAARHLLDHIEKAILDRRPWAESFEPYHSHHEREYPYYRIYVQNYIIFYVVIPVDETHKIMEIRRLLYNKQDRKKV